MICGKTHAFAAANDGTGKRPDCNIRPDYIRPDSAGAASCFVERSVTDPNERENHRDLNADCEHAQTCSYRPLA